MSDMDDDGDDPNHEKLGAHSAARRRARLELRRRARAAAEGAHRQGMSPPGRSLGRLVGRSVGPGLAFEFLNWCNNHTENLSKKLNLNLPRVQNTW